MDFQIKSEEETHLRTLLRCTSCRFVAYYYLPFYASLDGSGEDSRLLALFGILYWFVHSFATEALNRVADQTEDEINRPERTRLCHRIGYRRLRVLAASAFIALIGLDAVWLALDPNPILAVLLIGSALIGASYSIGPRLKRNPLVSPLILAFPSVGAFLIGWATYTTPGTQALHGFVFDIGPVLLVVGAAIFGIGGMKDITDVEGDALVGYRGLWVTIIESNARRIAAVLVALPFILVAVLVALAAVPLDRLIPAGILEIAGFLRPIEVNFTAWYLMLLALALPAFVIAKAAFDASSTADRRVARELMYYYWLTFVSVALCIHARSYTVLVVSVASIGYWRLMSRFMHWSPALRMQEAAGVLRRNDATGPNADR